MKHEKPVRQAERRDHWKKSFANAACFSHPTLYVCCSWKFHV